MVRTLAVAEAPPPPAPPRRSPINSNLTTAATVWHLRAALNVAALACRGTDEAAIIAGYNALLKTQKVALATAQASLSAEFKAGGGDWQDRYDDSMTRLYNFFSQAPARDRFCAVATSILAEGASVSPDQFTGFAGDRLALLDAPFAALLPPASPAAVMASAPLPIRPPVSSRPSIALAALTPTRPAASRATLRPIAPAPIQALAKPGHDKRPTLSLDLSALSTE